MRCRSAHAVYNGPPKKELFPYRAVACADLGRALFTKYRVSNVVQTPGSPTSPQFGTVNAIWKRTDNSGAGLFADFGGAPHDWSSYQAFGLTIQNNFSSDAQMQLAISTSGGGQISWAITIPGNQTVHIVAPISLYVWPLLNFPPTASSSLWPVLAPQHPIEVDWNPSSVIGWSLGAINDGTYNLTLSEAYLYTVSHTSALVDFMGQSKIHTWPTRIPAPSYLASYEAAEIYDLGDNPNVVSPYGVAPASIGVSGTVPSVSNWEAWKDADGVWWFVSPSGQIKWQLGVGSLDLTGSYTVVDDDRSKLFEGLPAISSPFYLTDGITGRQAFKFFAQALWDRWGASYLTTFYQRWLARVLSYNVALGPWNYNAGFHDGTSPAVWVLFGTTTPGQFAKGLYITTNRGSIEDPFYSGSTPATDFELYARQGFYDSFNGAGPFPMPEYVRSHIGTEVLGVVYDNEVPWADAASTNDADRYRIGFAVMQAPSTQPAKAAFVAWLQQSANAGPSYTNIAQLNSAWNTTYSSYTDLQNDTSPPALNATSRNDLKNFAYYWSLTYWAKVGAALQAVAPGVMLMGGKSVPSFTPLEIRQGMIDAGTVSVATWDDYTDPFITVLDFSWLSQLADPAFATPQYPSGIGSSRTIPSAILENAFGSPQSGNWAGSHATTARAASAFGVYVATAMRIKSCLGVDWFNGSPFPTTGEDSGGNQGHDESVTLTDTLNTPLPEMVQQLRTMGANLYAARMAAAGGAIDPYGAIGHALPFRPGVNGG